MIYQRLLNIDLEGNGCAVATPTGDGRWTPADAPVRIDQQVRASGKRSIDLATRPLFAHVDEAVFERPTYKTFIALLDNYVVNYAMKETTAPEEWDEIAAFLDAIVETPVMLAALEYINGDLGQRLTKDSYRKALQELWFVQYTNYFQGKSTYYCSGFEHVFVGEGKYNPKYGAAETVGEISGFHCWVKFYLDEMNGRVNYLGHKYDVRGKRGPESPVVVTLQMLWYHSDMAGRVRAELFKKIGGFFVGMSPECQIAMGTVAYFESIAGMFSGDRRRTTINGGTYDLVMFRNVDDDGRRGNRIRSFYPEYIGEAGGVSELEPAPTDRPLVKPALAAAKNNGAVVIVEASPNPGDGPEWVRIRNNTSSPIDLAEWEMRDRMGRPEPLSGTLLAGQDQRFVLQRKSPYSMQLGNKGGTILVYRNDELISSVSYGKAERGAIVRFAR